MLMRVKIPQKSIRMRMNVRMATKNGYFWMRVVGNLIIAKAMTESRPRAEKKKKGSSNSSCKVWAC